MFYENVQRPVVAWCSGNMLVSINVFYAVALHRARLRHDLLASKSETC